MILCPADNRSLDTHSPNSTDDAVGSRVTKKENGVQGADTEAGREHTRPQTNEFTPRKCRNSQTWPCGVLSICSWGARRHCAASYRPQSLVASLPRGCQRLALQARGSNCSLSWHYLWAEDARYVALPLSDKCGSYFGRKREKNEDPSHPDAPKFFLVSKTAYILCMYGTIFKFRKLKVWHLLSERERVLPHYLSTSPRKIQKYIKAIIIINNPIKPGSVFSRVGRVRFRVWLLVDLF